MKVVMSVFTVFSISLFFYSSPMHGMKKEWRLVSQCDLAEKYTDAYLIITQLPKESLLIANQSLEDSIKILMKLSKLNRDFNDYLTPEKMGSFCKSYDQHTKNYTLDSLATNNYFSTNYELMCTVKRLPMVIMVYAGADVATYKNWKIFQRVVKENDIPFAQLLFEKFTSLAPCFGNVTTIEMAQLYADHNCFDACSEIACKSNGHPNYLWTMIDSKYTVELMEFCFKQGSCPRKLGNWGNLLHGIASIHFLGRVENRQDIDLFLKKAQFVLSIIPDMINDLNDRGETPLDKLYESIESLKDSKRRAAKLNNISVNYQRIENKIFAYEQLIALYRNHGALTAQELEQQK